MAEEVKKIITVEVGKSITSVRDFKKHIEDLRGALLALNENSDEYKKIAEEITNNQNKLNEVMAIGKKNTDAASGSYNALNNQLKSLRAQYKALSETERNGTTGQTILQSITKLDTQLKELDAGMGQYQRNVGNYQGAFEEAFKAISRDIGNINPEIGKLMQTASSLIPLIKKATTAATTGLKGVKAAMASTGIGLLVVALGEIVAHWEQIYAWIQKVLGKQKDLTKETRDTTRAASDLANELKKANDNYNLILTGAGYNSEERTQRVLDSNRRQLKDVEDKIKVLERHQKSLEGIKEVVEDNNSVFQNNTKAWDGYYKLLRDSTNEIEDDLTHSTNELGFELRRITNEMLPKDFRGVNRSIKLITAEIQKDIDALREKGKEIQGLISQNENQLQNIQDSAFERARDAGKAAGDALKSEAERRTEQYRKEYWEMYEAYEKEMKRIRNVAVNSEDEARAKNEALINLEEEKNTSLLNLEKQFQSDLKQIQKKEWESSDAYKKLEQDKQDAENLYKSIEDYGKLELQVLDENYKKQLKLLEDFGYDTTLLTKKYLDERQALIDKDTQEGLDKLREQEEAELQIRRDAFQKLLDEQGRGEFLDSSAASTMWTINTKTHETDINLERQKEDRIYEIRKEGYNRRIELYEEHLLTLEAGSEEYLDLERQITEAKMDLDDLGYQHAVALEERKREDIQLTLQKWQEAVNFAQSTVSIFGSIAGSIADYTLEYAEEGTEAYRAAQITQAVISTLNGMVGVFSQALSAYGLPWGAVIGGIGAAAMGTIGALRIGQIRNANSNTNVSGGSSTNVPSVGVEPLLNEQYDLQRMTNLSLQSDDFLPGNTQVYVLESDIQEVGTRVQVREQNATF